MRRGLFLALCCAALLGALCRPAFRGFPGPAFAGGADEIVIALESTPPHLNPALMSGSTVTAVGAQLYAGLTRLDAAGNALPYLAESWETAPDGLSVRFTLRRNAFFHDGRPVTSQDVAYSILKSRDCHPFRPMLESVTGVDAPSPFTAVVRLSRPFPLLPKVLVPSLVPILPRHVFDDGRPFPTHPANREAVGSGPFMLESFVPDRFIRLRRNPRFFLPGKPLAERLTFRIFWDQGEIPLALAAGEVDAYLFASCLQLRRFLDDYKFAPFAVLPLGNLHSYTVFSYNLRRKPFSDRRVRRAFALAVDRNFIARRLLHGMVEPLSGPIPPGAPFHTPLPAPHDIEEADRLLDEAGYPRGKDGKRFSLIVDYSPDSPLPRELLRLLQYELAARLGIEVRTRDSQSVSDWMRRVVADDYQVVLDELFAWHDPVIGIHRLYSKNNSGRGIVWANSSGYASDEAETLMRQASEEADPQRRQSLYDALQRRLADDCALLWLTTSPYSVVARPSLRHLEKLGLGLMSPLDGIEKAPAPGAAP